MIFARILCFSFFFFNDTATTEIYTLSLHDALPILRVCSNNNGIILPATCPVTTPADPEPTTYVLTTIDVTYTYVDRKSTRLNSSHLVISYAVFCLKKKNSSTATV